MKKLILFDFDGVIHSYISGWKGVNVIEDEPVPGMRDLIKKLKKTKKYTVKIFSTRCLTAQGVREMTKYLKMNDIEIDGFTTNKEKAFLLIDDRCICFDGNTESLFDKIEGFEPWTNQPEIVLEINKMIDLEKEKKKRGIK